MTRLTTLTILLVALASTARAQRDQEVCATDPYADPSQDPCNPFRYVPSLAVNLIGALLYIGVGSILAWQNWRHRANYMLCLIIGSFTEATGLILRIVLRYNLHSTGLYTVQYLFVVLSPTTFLAADYILLGRLVGHLDGARYLKPFRPMLVSWIFISSDITTFIIQAIGGILSSSSPANAETGSRVFLGGIAAQMASFALFTFLWARFAYKVRYQDQTLWTRPGWRPLHWALGWTCIFFNVRSVYRTIELSQGYIGYLATHEVFIITLDTLPLLLGIAAYCYFWPGKYLTPETRVRREGEAKALEAGAVREIDENVAPQV